MAAPPEVGVILRVMWAWTCPECATDNYTETATPKLVYCEHCTREYPCQTPKTLGGTS